MPEFLTFKDHNVYKGSEASLAPTQIKTEETAEEPLDTRMLQTAGKTVTVSQHSHADNPKLFISHEPMTD